MEHSAIRRHVIPFCLIFQDRSKLNCLTGAFLALWLTDFVRCSRSFM